MSTTSVPYLGEVRTYVEDRLHDPTAVLGALAAILSDPGAYGGAKGEPGLGVLDYVHELLLTDRALQEHFSDPSTPVSRELFGSRWSAVWHHARRPSDLPTSYEYAVCISFAGSDRPIAERIANALRSGKIPREVFYDEFEKTDLWGQDLLNHLYEVYSRRSMLCLILFSHAYRERAWTRHELRAAQSRLLAERRSYVLPVELDKGAVPDQFGTIGYWSFSPGDESAIANATEQKINDWIGAHYFSIEELTEAVNRNRVASAILQGFRKGIQARPDEDPLVLAALRALALIAVSNHDRLIPPMGALLQWVLFADGAIGNLFDTNDRLVLFNDAGVRRWTGQQGPLLFDELGWKSHLAEVLQHGEDAEAGPEADNSAA